MQNVFAQRAVDRASRRGKVPQNKPVLTSRSDDMQLSLAQYLLAHQHLAACWREARSAELAWFLQSMRGELPAPRIAPKNYTIYHVHLKPAQYLLALEALTTRLGVRKGDEIPRAAQ